MVKGCKKKSMSSILRRTAAVTLAAVTAFSSAACGNKESSGDAAQAKEWAYVPEFITIDEENVNYYDMQVVGENIYYLSYDWDEATGVSSQSICKYSLADRKITSVPITWLEEGGNQSINRGSFGEDGSMYAVMYSYNEDYSEAKQSLTKFDGSGKQLFSNDMSDLVGDSYVDTLAVDGEGRLYVTGDSQIWLFDAEGNRQGTVTMNGGGDIWIDSLACGRDGRMYMGYSNYDGNTSSYTLCEIDFDGKKLGQVYEGVPRNNGFIAGTEYDFLLTDGTALYGYDLAKKEKEYLFDWLDSDINGNNVRKFSQLEDGRILAVIEDWENNDSGIALLTKKKAEEVPQKETIVVATMGGSYSLQSRAVKFNKASDKYHISVRDYVDYNNWTENTWSDALTNLNNDITSSNNCPDMIDLANLNIPQLVAKDVLEDLSPYLEKSGRVNRGDFVENILEAYTYDGRLVSVPSYFSMRTVIGSASMVGSEGGWTLEQLIALANEHPDAELFDRVSKLSILQTAMMFNEDAFINWETGECSFDTDGFKNILEFVNRFPDEVNWEQGADSEPARIQNGEVLLSDAFIYDFNQLQMYNEIFQGDYNCVGFPTVDGSGGHALSASEAYAITTKSEKKDGAWEFLESILAEEDNNLYYSGFPTLKSKLEKMAEEAVTPDYVTDENGEIMKDENGEAIINEGVSSVGYEDGWSYTYRLATQEEVDKVMELMDLAKPVSYNGDDEISKIINEEAEAFFKGQKSVDEVAGIIQNCVNNYVGETK